MSTDKDVFETSIINNRLWREVATSQRDRAAAEDGDVRDDDQGPVKFRVATYNVLSDTYLQDGKYEYCPAHLRFMSSRHERIVAEISNMQPHVICLQVCLSVCLSLSYTVCVGSMKRRVAMP